MVALIEVTITSLMKSPLIEVIVTSPINEQMVGAIVIQGDPDQNCYSDGCNIENMLFDTTFKKIHYF